MNTEKPPIGLVPKFIRDELRQKEFSYLKKENFPFDENELNRKFDLNRINEINEAIARYNEASYPIPEEWTKEKENLLQNIGESDFVRLVDAIENFGYSEEEVEYSYEQDNGDCIYFREHWRVPDDIVWKGAYIMNPKDSKRNFIFDKDEKLVGEFDGIIFKKISYQQAIEIIKP